jgi:hypothetical protein
MKTRLLALVAFGVLATCLIQNTYGQQPQSPPGQIKAVRVMGQVTVTRAADNATIALQNNAALTQGDVVTTAKNASVVLVFSNGSTVSLGQDSKLAVDEFLQDPFAEAVKVSQIKEEPSTSHTKLNLTYGELVGNVKKLKGASSFLVQTPVGAAGIRGTTFRLVYRPSGAGQAFFTLSTATGEVIFQGSTGTPVPVSENKEVVVQVTINDATGAVESVQVTSTNISAEAAQAIAQQVAEALQSVDATVFDNIEATPPERPTAPPPETQTPPRTTAGAGTSG